MILDSDIYIYIYISNNYDSYINNKGSDDKHDWSWDWDNDIIDDILLLMMRIILMILYS